MLYLEAVSSTLAPPANPGRHRCRTELPDTKQVAIRLILSYRHTWFHVFFLSQVEHAQSDGVGIRLFFYALVSAAVSAASILLLI